MAVHSGANLHMSQVNAEFGWGNNIAAYRGRQWYMDNGATGHFSSGQIGMSEFRGKRPTSPAGINAANYVWEGGVPSGGATVNLGAAAADRYIVVAVGHWGRTVNTVPAQCLLGGTQLPVLSNNNHTQLMDGAENHYKQTYIYGAYYPNGTSAAMNINTAAGAYVGGGGTYAYVFALNGNGLALRGSWTANQGTASSSISVPNKTQVIGMGIKQNHNFPTLPNLDWIAVHNWGTAGEKSGASVGIGWRYYPNATAAPVASTAGGNSTNWVAIG